MIKEETQPTAAAVQRTAKISASLIAKVIVDYD